MKLLYTIIYIITLFLLSGCSIFSGKLTTDPNIKAIDKPLYKSTPNAIVLEWKPRFNDYNIDGYNIYKKTPYDKDLKLIATIKSRYVSHYVDSNLLPNRTYIYGITVYSGKGKESQIKSLLSAVTKKTLEPIPYVVAISGLPKLVKILWRIYDDRGVTSYIVERRTSSGWKIIGKVKNRLNVEFIDSGLEDNREYSYRVIAVTGNDIHSKPSQVVTARTKNVITNRSLKAYSLIKKIKLTWNKNDDTVKKYIIYRGKKKDDLSKLVTIDGKYNSYTDNIGKDNTYFYYYLVQKDMYNIESKQSNIVFSHTVLSPKAPKILGYTIKNNILHINVDIQTVYINSKLYVSVEAKKGFLGSTKRVYQFNEGSSNFVYRLNKGYVYSFKVFYIKSNGLHSEYNLLKNIELK